MASALLQEAEAKLKARDLDAALALFDRAVEAAPGDAAALAGRAAARNRRKEHLDAVADCLAALALDPKLPAAHRQQGLAYFDLGEYEAAKAAFEAAAVLEPAVGAHKAWLNMCRVRLGEEVPKEPPARAAGGGGGSPPPPRARGGAAAAAAEPAPDFERYWKQPLAPAVAAAVAAADARPPGARYRHQWLQSPAAVEVAVLAKGLRREAVAVEFAPRRLVVTIQPGDGGAGSQAAGEGAQQQQKGQQQEAAAAPYVLDLALAGAVDPGRCVFEVLRSKVEVRMPKAAPGEAWPALEAAAAAAPAAPAPAAAGAPPGPSTAAAAAAAAAGDTAGPANPYSAPGGRRVDWDALDREAAAADAAEPLDGDAGAMRFFRRLYADADEDTRRAMWKSYEESGGRALSTNWADVGSKSFKEEDRKRAEEEEKRGGRTGGGLRIS